ncbi:MAG: hydroxymethylglutaryl-CoA synthase [Deltaproteobacteria bacterium]|jgi:hydroxymethylglutaryl-CoA synthase
MREDHRPESTGIAALGLAVPPLAMDVTELAALRGVDPDKYTVGLGCRTMALCPEGYGVVDLAETAARRALESWGGSAEDIGLIAVGTESALDMSRPLSAFVADRLGVRGSVRSYEVKHACYGGTLALRQAVEWRASGAARDKAALVIAADVALYAPEDPGEATQGAGAVAMIVHDPAVAAVGIDAHAFSEPAFDFWRPVGESFPRVDGKFSLECYMRAAAACFSSWVGEDDARAKIEALSAACLHAPFPKMVKKAVRRVGETFGWSADETERLFAEKVAPAMSWNTEIGNSYTGSLWFAVARALAGAERGESVVAFSYGSGFGAELFELTAGPAAKAAAWAAPLEADLAARQHIDRIRYQALRAS